MMRGALADTKHVKQKDTLILTKTLSWSLLSHNAILHS